MNRRKRHTNTHPDRHTHTHTDHHVNESGEAPESIDFILHDDENWRQQITHSLNVACIQLLPSSSSSASSSSSSPVTTVDQVNLSLVVFHRLVLKEKPFGTDIYSPGTQPSEVDSAFYPLWDSKMSTSQIMVMLCGRKGNRRPGGNYWQPTAGWMNCLYTVISPGPNAW